METDRHVTGFKVSCGDCNKELVPTCSGDLDELLGRAEFAQRAHAHHCTASDLRKLVNIIYNKLTGPRVRIDGKKVKLSIPGEK